MELKKITSKRTEAKIITDLKRIITYDAAKRSNQEEAMKAFERLNVSVSEQVKRFYFNFAGPFECHALGSLKLLDIVDDDPNIESITKICREQLKFPNQYLVATDYIVGEVTVLDTLSNKLYTVCIECGEDKDLLNGNLKPDWQSFDEFLKDYFGLC